MALLRFDSRPWIAKIETETLVVIPTSDELVPPAWQYELAASLPNATVVELPGVRHEAPWTHPDRVVEVISSFVG
jgi:pimeloyl-ACP methyl ester carboxylesterase